MNPFIVKLCFDSGATTLLSKTQRIPGSFNAWLEQDRYWEDLSIVSFFNKTCKILENLSTCWIFPYASSPKNKQLITLCPVLSFMVFVWHRALCLWLWAGFWHNFCSKMQLDFQGRSLGPLINMYKDIDYCPHAHSSWLKKKWEGRVQQTELSIWQRQSY